MTTTLVFRNTVLETISLQGQLWLTSAELAKALEYSISKSVTDLFNKNADEFSPCMSKVVESTTLGKSRNKTRIFSLRGAHLIAMLSRTPVAKEFRKWVLDILDKEVRTPVYQPESHELFTANDTSNLARLIWHMSHNFRFEQAWSNGIWYALREVTGIASPQPMEVRHIPHIARECERIWAVIERLQSAIVDAERRTIRQLVRKRENVDSVMGEIDSLLIEASQSNAFMLTDTLTRWHKSELGQFAQRH